MQVDPVVSDQDLWNWQQNVTDGAAVVTQAGVGGNAFWQRQLSQWTAYNQANPKHTVSAPVNTTEAGCVFSYAPTAGQYPYDDAVTIKR